MSKLLRNLQTRIETNVRKELGIECINGFVFYDSDFKELLLDAQVDIKFEPNGAHLSRGADSVVLPYQILPNRHGMHLENETLIKFFPSDY